MSIWWLSYASEADGNRGVVIVRAESFFGAVAESRRLGLSPGGEVRGFEVPSEEARLEPYVGRWLSPNEARELA